MTQKTENLSLTREESFNPNLTNSFLFIVI